MNKKGTWDTVAAICVDSDTMEENLSRSGPMLPA